MTIDELITHLQNLAKEGHGQSEIAVAISTNPNRVARISQIVAPDPDPESDEPEVRETAWLIAYPTYFDGMPYAPDYLGV